MPLTDRQIKNAKPAAKAYKLTDGSGLYLQVTPAGGKLWRFDYAIANKRKTLSIGKYPLISLLEAREQRRRIAAPGIFAAQGRPLGLLHYRRRVGIWRNRLIGRCKRQSFQSHRQNTPLLALLLNTPDFIIRRYLPAAYHVIHQQGCFQAFHCRHIIHFPNNAYCICFFRAFLHLYT